MAWGLLQGVGRGLSQGAELLSRGMQEDRAVERERLREESIAKRWARQEAREDDYRQGRDKAMDDRMSRQEAAQSAAANRAQDNADRDYNLRRDQLNQSGLLQRLGQIESNFGGIMSAQEKSEAKITDKYTRLMSREGITKEEFTALNQQFTDEVKQNRDHYSAKIEQFKASYGDSLKGTSYEYLLHVKPDAAADDTAGAADQVSTTAGGGSSGRGDYVKNSVVSNDSASAEPSAPKPGFISGVGNGFSGFYNASPAADFSGASPWDYIKHGVGSVVGGVAGLPGDALQMAGKGLLPMYTALTSPVSSPSNITAPELAYAQQRFGGGNPPPIPGKTAEQYALRTGIKK